MNYANSKGLFWLNSNNTVRQIGTRDASNIPFRNSVKISEHVNTCCIEQFSSLEKTCLLRAAVYLSVGMFVCPPVSLSV